MDKCKPDDSKRDADAAAADHLPRSVILKVHPVSKEQQNDGEGIHLTDYMEFIATLSSESTESEETSRHNEETEETSSTEIVESWVHSNQHNDNTYNDKMKQ